MAPIGHELGLGLGLAAFTLALIAQRLIELAISARHVRILAARGAVERGARHFPLLVAIHALFPVALVLEVWLLGARPWPTWPLWLALYIAAGLLRALVIRTLRERWTLRIWVVPGSAPIRSGPYRWLSHPNYLAVTIETLAGPLMFGAWRTAIGITTLYLLALALRVPAEERALAEAADSPLSR